jgi:hypothetical protein
MLAMNSIYLLTSLRATSSAGSGYIYRLVPVCRVEALSIFRKHYLYMSFSLTEPYLLLSSVLFFVSLSNLL